MKFTEEKLEKAFIELLGNENFPHHSGASIARAAEEVLIEADLLQYLLSKYESKQLTVTEAKSIILQLKTLPASDLYESNKTIMRWLSDGFILKREDRNQKDIHIELIDYNGLDAQLASQHLDIIVASPPAKYGRNYNIYKFVNQLEIVGSEKRIPDGIIYINGLPVVVFEFKSAIREEATIFDAFNQLTIRYRRDIPELFKYNAFCVISDGVNNKAGSFFAPYEFYYAWRRIAGLAKDVDGIDSMFTLVQGMFQHDRLRDIIRNFIYIPDSSKKNEHTHFYMAVRSIVFKLTKGNAPDTAQMNARVREMIKDALASDGVEEIFKLGEEQETEQDIFDEDYLAKIDKIKLPHTKIKLLQQLLAKVIGEMKKINKVKGVDFTRKMQVLVERYNQRDENDILRSEVYEEMAEQLTNLIWEVHKEFKAGDELGIDFEEKAFYDILKELCVKYDFNYPEDKLIELAKRVKDLVDAQAKFPDWNKRDDIKSALKVGLILLLDEFGYPPVERDEVYFEIFEQAENFKKNRITT